MADTTAIPPVGTETTAQIAAHNTVRLQALNNENFIAAINHSTQVDNSNAVLPSSPSPSPLPLPNAPVKADETFLLNLDAKALSLLNQFSADPRSASISGNLTTQQLQEINILQEDAQRLEEASVLVSHSPLASGATTVDLSADAQGIISHGIAPSPLAGVPTALSPTQLEQLGRILAPLAAAPLTPQLLAQIQNAVAATGANSLQLSLNTIFLVLQYMGNLQTSHVDDGRARAEENADTQDDLTVTATEATTPAHN